MTSSAQPSSPLTADLIRICEALEERYGRRKPAPHPDFIEALAYQILDLGVSEKAARDALKRLRDEYVDWNDMRVATVREIMDVLGAKYHRVREKAEDLRHLLADIYTAFRRMDIKDLLNAEGIATLRALPETTNIRRDMVERALVLMCDVKVLPIDEDQFRLLKFFAGATKTAGNALKPLAFQVGCKKIEDALDTEGMLRLSRGLREHWHTLQLADEDEPQPIAFGWDRKDPLGQDPKGKKEKAKPAAAKKKS
jgi:endonuclease III